MVVEPIRWRLWSAPVRGVLVKRKRVSTHAQCGLLGVLGEVARIPAQHLRSGETSLLTVPSLKLLVPHLYGHECGKGPNATLDAT